MGTSHGKEASIVNLDPENEDSTIQNDVLYLTTNEMQKEFDDIYERSNLILKSLVRNPCQELEQRITDCLKNNPLQMAKCFGVMDNYQTCVTEDTLLQMLERVAMIKEN